MSIAKQVGVLNPDLDGAQDYDYILRCAEKTDSIYHIPKILYHWRCHENSTSENPDSKLYAFKAGKKHLKTILKERKLMLRLKKDHIMGLITSYTGIVRQRQ